MNKRTILTIAILIMIIAVIFGINVYLNQPVKVTISCENYDADVYRCTVVNTALDIRLGINIVNYCNHRGNSSSIQGLDDCLNNAWSQGDCYNINNNLVSGFTQIEDAIVQGIGYCKLTKNIKLYPNK